MEASGAAYRPASAGASHFFSHQQPAAAQHMAVTQPLRGESAGAARTAAKHGRRAVRRTGRASGTEWRERWTQLRHGRRTVRRAMGRAAKSGDAEHAARRFSRRPGPTQRRRMAALWRAEHGRRQEFGRRSASRRRFATQPRSNGDMGGRPESMRISPPVVHERSSTPSYSAPRQSAPSYSAPRQSAPRL